MLLHADKGYDYDLLRHWLRTRRIIPRIAHTGIESSQKLGRYWWVVERTISWLLNYRSLAQRWEHCPHNFTAFLTLTATLICYKKTTY